MHGLSNPLCFTTEVEFGNEDSEYVCPLTYLVTQKLDAEMQDESCSFLLEANRSVDDMADEDADSGAEKAACCFVVR